jgi:hypothetical protein
MFQHLVSNGQTWLGQTWLGQTWLTPNKWSSIQTVLSFLRYHIPFGTR